jgi:hypothetical protein
MANKPVYQANPFLARALKKLAKKKSEKMIVFLVWENVDCTNNHVERNNRVFRMMQKTRYKRRRTHTIQMALELDLYARMLSHPLYLTFLQQKIVALPISTEQMAYINRAA